MPKDLASAARDDSVTTPGGMHAVGMPARRRIAPPVLAWSTATVLFVLFAVLALQRHAQLLTTGYDLGIFEQEVRSYAAGQLPTSLLKGIDYPLLGDHFSPIVATIAPFYALFPHPQTLLIAQAALLAVGAVPLVLWATRRLGLGAGLAVAAGYGLAGGLAHAVAFDFHEIAFAVPLLACSLTALGRRRSVAAVVWALPLLLVKEDLGVTTAVIAGIAAYRTRPRGAWGARRRRAFVFALVAVVVGVAGTLVETFVVIPAFNPGGADAYTHQLSIEGALAGVGDPAATDAKLATLMRLLLPTAFLAVRSPLVLAAVPTLAWRFASDNPAYWGTSFHYDAVLVPIVTAALVDALLRIERRGHPTAARRGWPLAAGALTLALLPGSPLLQLATTALWQGDAHVAAAKAILAEIPDGVTVAASNGLVPQLTARDEVSQVGVLSISTSRPDYVVVDSRGTGAFAWPTDAAGLSRAVSEAESLGYRRVASDEGITLLIAPTAR